MSQNLSLDHHAQLLYYYTSYRLLEDYLKEKESGLFEVVYFIGGIKDDGSVKVSLISI